MESTCAPGTSRGEWSPPTRNQRPHDQFGRNYRRLIPAAAIVHGMKCVVGGTPTPLSQVRRSAQSDRYFISFHLFLIQVYQQLLHAQL